MRGISQTGWEGKLKEIVVYGEFAIELDRKMGVKSKREVIKADGVENTERLNGGI